MSPGSRHRQRLAGVIERNPFIAVCTTQQRIRTSCDLPLPLSPAQQRFLSKRSAVLYPPIRDNKQVGILWDSPPSAVAMTVLTLDVPPLLQIAHIALAKAEQTKKPPTSGKKAAASKELAKTGAGVTKKKAADAKEAAREPQRAAKAAK